MIVTASTTLSSFNCPHCGVLAQQFWWSSTARKLGDGEIPHINRTSERGNLIERYAKAVKDDPAKIADFTEWVERTESGEILFADAPDTPHTRAVTNLHFSRCYACNRISVWIHDKLVHPPKYDAPSANPDMPADVAAEYREAALIAVQSPRGAAALLRLAIQRLMPHLGQMSGNLNTDIKALVAGGMDPKIQRALDVVRVTGNHAVHPGTLDLNDDGRTVGTMFKLVNVIVDATISQHLHIEEAYGALPESARRQIEQRDSDS